MSETLRTGERFLKKLAAMMDGLTMEANQLEDEKKKRKANSFLWKIRLYFCLLTREAMEDEELNEKVSLTLRELAEKNIESSFYAALFGMLEVATSDSDSGLPAELADLVEGIALEAIEEKRDRLKEEILGKVGSNSGREEKNRMWA